MNNSKGKFVAKYKTTLLSTGVATLDGLMNGGLAVGTVTLIEEDTMNCHSALLCQHFVSSGVSSGQDTALVTDEIAPQTYFENLPKIVTAKSITNETNQLNIAWRYRDIGPVAHGDNFVEKPTESSSNILYFSSHFISKPTLSENIKDVLNFLSIFIKEKSRPRKPLRLVISSLGSPLWGVYENEKNCFRDIFRFLFCLKQLATEYSIVALVSISSILFDHVDLMANIQTISNYVFKFEAFEDPKSVGDQLHNDISGQIRPIKIPCINSIEPIFRPNTIIWSYHVRRKKILVKEFSLPPCLSDNTSRTSQNEPSRKINSNMGCSSGLDF